jgi:adhesin transport system membrane fusion protein
VRPNDRASLRAGLPTQVKVGAYDYAIYGALAGHLVEVSADTLPDETGQRYYRVLIQTDAPSARMAAVSILPGMTATADVVLGQRSVLTYLLSPLLRFQQRAFTEPT